MPRRKASLAPTTWWAERWLETVARGSERSRAQRGRGYAKGGRVEELVLEPGLIAARVQGTRPAPYRVEVRIPTFDEATWRQAVGLMARQAGVVAALLVGELPPAAEEALQGLGASLFPRPEERVAIGCSCPDWERPCKHAMAVFQLVAARIETDPFALFAIRGRPREELLAALRAARAATASDDSPASGSAPAAPARTLADELTADPVPFWALAPEPAAEAGRASPPALKRLPPPPAALGGALLRQELAAAYAILAQRAARAAGAPDGGGLAADA